MQSVIIKKGEIDFAADSSVKEVTIYSDRALVTRIRASRCEKGENRVTFSNLGSAIDEQSLKASVVARGARIVAASLDKKHLYFFKEEEDENTYARLIDVLAGMCVLDDMAAIHALENRILTDLHDYIRSLLNPLILAQENSIPKFKEALDFCRSMLEKNAGSFIENAIEIERRSEEYGFLREKLDRIRSLDTREQNNVVIAIYANEAIDADVELTYALSGASWRPSYDSKADTGGKTVELSCFGEIMQSTGETWERARVVLSTSVSEYSPEIPPVYPAYLGGYEDKRTKEIVVEETAINRLDKDALVDEDRPEDSHEREEGEAKDLESWEERISAEKKGVSYTFTIEDPIDVPPDGRWHRGLIMRSHVPARLFFDTVPGLEEYVYNLAEVTNTLSIPILPGSVFVYRNGSYMGKSSLSYVAPEEKFCLSFGIDDDLRVKRIEFKNVSIPARGLSARNLREWEYHFILYNYKKKSELVRIREGIYVSSIKEIEVKVEKDSTPGFTLDEEGIVTWELELPPDPFKHTKLVLHYTLSAPRDFNTGNL
jgi:uncharacterized protein (TIGR02231 family)